MIHFACPSCSKVLQAPEQRAGTTAVCPGCRQELQVPAPPPAAPYREGQPLPVPVGGPIPVPRRAPDDADEGYPPGPDRPWPGRRAEGPSGNWGWRWASPSVLVTALFLLPLPFLEVQCTTPGARLALLSQSGIQIMTGGWSRDSTLDDFERQMQKLGGGAVPMKRADPNLEVKPAHLMWFVPLVLLAAAVVGFAVRPAAWRLPVVGTLTATALGMIFVQMAIGFPIEKEVQESIRREEEAAAKLRGNNPFGGPGVGNPFGGPGVGNPFGGPGVGNPFGGGPGGLASTVIQTRYTPIFWIWLVLIVGALGPLVGEAVSSGTRRRTWRPPYDPDY